MPAHTCDAVIANQSLHHILKLEDLFEQVKKSLAPGGCFIISDMIGRNGHQRWPEALEAVHAFWRLAARRLTVSTCDSTVTRNSFRIGIARRRDSRASAPRIFLPLLLQYFHFRLFVPFGNVIDPFTDRSFGHHFDPEAEWDRAFIDRVQAHDDAGLAAGLLTPTHMLAVVGNDASVETAFPGNLSPHFCLRTRDETTHAPADQAPAYDWFSWPHDPREDLKAVCLRLGRSEAREQELLSWGARLDQELTTRTIWALNLQKELEERTAWALRTQEDLQDVQRELAERTVWARRLESELEERTVWVRNLLDEIEADKGGAASAQQLRVELEARNAELQIKNQDVSKLSQYPFRLLIKALRDRIQDRLRAKIRPS